MFHAESQRNLSRRGAEAQRNANKNLRILRFKSAESAGKIIEFLLT